MPAYDIAARYQGAIAAPPERVYATLMTTDLGKPWMVRALMGLRLIPDLVRAPRAAWRRMKTPRSSPRASLSDLSHSSFVLLEQSPPREIVLGITGRFWTFSPAIESVPAARFRDRIPPGLARAAWNFEVTAVDGGSRLVTETRVECADQSTLRQFRRYWRFVAPGSGLIRRAMLGQIRREATCQQ
jgi:uncharacterized protein YndB with AHSA1/START domain